MERKLSTIEFAFRLRPHVKTQGGSSSSERNFLDFIVDGQSLAERTRYDLVSVLCKEWLAAERERSVRRLLGEEAADFADDRRSILVCPGCGDIGCGAVSAVVLFSDKTTLWRDFGYQNNYEPEIHGEHLKDIGPFEFDLSDYKRKLIRALETIKTPL
jgi:hypothetical protein